MASFTLGILVPFMVIGPLYGRIVKKIKKEVIKIVVIVRWTNYTERSR